MSMEIREFSMIDQDTYLGDLPEDIRNAVADAVRSAMMIQFLEATGGDTTKYELKYQQQIAKCRKLAQRYKPRCSLLGDVLNAYF